MDRLTAIFCADGLGEGQCGAFGVGEEGCVAPGDQGEQSLVGLAVFLGFGRGAGACAATVDLAGSQVNQVECPGWYAALFDGLASFSALIAVMASGMTTPGFRIRACIAALLLLSV
jgi:hypothetical protein